MPFSAKLLASVLLAAPRFSDASTWAMHKCKGEICDNPEFPMLDWNGEKCVCRKHPCWEDNGKAHSCPNSEAPFLKFAYNEDGSLVCSCSATAHSGSVFVSSELCPGQTCEEPEHPVLDFSDEKGSCVCSSHPCANDNGKSHSCANDEFPVLTFTYNKDDALQCACSKKYLVPDAKKDL